MALELNASKHRIYEYVESRMSFIAPNLSIIIGASTAAKIMGEFPAGSHGLGLLVDYVVLRKWGLMLGALLCCHLETEVSQLGAATPSKNSWLKQVTQMTMDQLPPANRFILDPGASTE